MSEISAFAAHETTLADVADTMRMKNRLRATRDALMLIGHGHRFRIAIGSQPVFLSPWGELEIHRLIEQDLNQQKAEMEQELAWRGAI
jgi:hypothetical protein